MSHGPASVRPVVLPIELWSKRQVLSSEKTAIQMQYKTGGSLK